MKLLGPLIKEAQFYPRSSEYETFLLYPVKINDPLFSFLCYHLILHKIKSLLWPVLTIHSILTDPSTGNYNRCPLSVYAIDHKSTAISLTGKKC